MTSLTTYFRRLALWVRTHARTAVLALLAFLCVVAALVWLLRDKEAAPEESDAPRTVAVASVAALALDTDPLVVLGEVRSVSQAELRAEKPGEVIRVNVRPGQRVSAGTVLAEIENGAERAAVLQAQGVLAAAQANLAKVRAGDRAQDTAGAIASAQGSQVSLDAAKDSARTAYSQAYTAAADAVYGKTDDFFQNPYTVSPSFRVLSATYDERAAVSRERVALGELLTAWQPRATAPLSDAALDERLTQADADLRRIKAYLSTISGYISRQDITTELSAETKSAQEASLLAARSAVDGARSGIAGARTSLANARNAATQGALSVSKSIEGARPEDLAAAQAQVTQARGTVAAAVAQLERSIVRTPIAGTVTTLNMTRGGYASGQDVLAVVANPGALEVEAFVSATARERLYVGMPVLVGGSARGTVTTLAPGLDPATKKARLTVGLPDNKTYVNGQFVELALIEDERATSTRAAFLPDQGIPLPLTAIKVLPAGLVVFTVENDVLKPLPVEEGPITGTRMLVRGELTQDTRIVVDARGLAEGDRVAVSTE